MKKLLIIGAAAMLLVPLAVLADTYQFFVSGYPAANVSYSAASSGTSLDSRYRTWGVSNGIALRSDKPCGVIIYIR